MNNKVKTRPGFRSIRWLLGVIINVAIVSAILMAYIFFRPDPPAWCNEKAVEAVKKSPAGRENLTIHQAVWRIYDRIKFHHHSMRVGKYRTREIKDSPDLCEVQFRYTIDDHPFTAFWRLNSSLEIVERNREAQKIENLELRH